ncbi:MAG: biotin--[acetyl-CoA-carboxylase] ligase [Patescibacteria group bacterium]|nr:biotin--[acetyl-CoA-carboxylase] ligase [Patescibacteria group bacterium]
MSVDTGKLYDFSRLADLVRPLKLHSTRITASTNDWAKQETQSGAGRVPALFVAGSQSAGRGRGTNAWWSPLGNVAATFVLVQNAHIAFGLVPLLAGLAVRRALVRLTACDDICLKWPNDLVVGQRKAAGLLCERLQRADLLGVGVNVNAGSSEGPAELRERITSLRELTGKVWDLTQVLCEISRELRQVFSLESENTARQLLQEYSQHHWPTGKQIELVDADRAPRVGGCCIGVDPEGRLIVGTGQTSRSFLTGSIVSVTSATE